MRQWEISADYCRNDHFIIKSDDHKILKDFGYDDKQVVEITAVVAAFNWANIIADALGTEIES